VEPSEKQRRKPAEKRREKFLRVRLTDEQDRLMKEAADAAGITVSSWAVERLVKSARAELRQRGAPPSPTSPGGAPD
jgi:uncharacterized protein (DUF1778 family)